MASANKRKRVQVKGEEETERGSEEEEMTEEEMEEEEMEEEEMEKEEIEKKEMQEDEMEEEEEDKEEKWFTHFKKKQEGGDGETVPSQGFYSSPETRTRITSDW